MRRTLGCLLALLLVMSTAAFGAERTVLTVDSARLTEGTDTLTLDVTLEGGGSCSGGSFILWYDSGCLELISLEAGPAVDGALTAVNPDLGDGVAKMSWASLSPLTAEGVVARLTFRVLLMEETTVEVLNPELLDTEGKAIPLASVNGAVTLQQAETPVQDQQPSSGSTSSGGANGSAGGGDTGPADWDNPFSDVPEGAWFWGAVEYVVREGLFTGTDADRFSPDSTMSRAMLATVLYRRFGAEANPTVISAFSDAGEVPSWAADGMAWAVEQGILQGSGGRLMPNAPVTRETLATILYRCMGNPGGDAAVLESFVDGASVAPWAEEGAAWAVETGLLTGRDGGRLVPGDTATRAEVAMVLSRWLPEIS